MIHKFKQEGGRNILFEWFSKIASKHSVVQFSLSCYT